MDKFYGLRIHNSLNLVHGELVPSPLDNKDVLVKNAHDLPAKLKSPI
ncbi:MAG: hypothetical protein HUJ51_00755 [Eggerthellaceae bacterium]|nr:hypothetical protein [Eggerthellaceae bacterium]